MPRCFIVYIKALSWSYKKPRYACLWWYEWASIFQNGCFAYGIDRGSRKCINFMCLL